MKQTIYAILAGLGLAVVGTTASANETVRAACEANASLEALDCACVSDGFDENAADLSAAQKETLADLMAQSLGDKAAAARIASADPMTFMAISEEMSLLGDLPANCVSSEKEAEMEQAENEATRLNAEADAKAAAYEAEMAAIPTAPAPPEVTDPDNHPALAGSAGVDAATRFRDVVIAECMSFGNSAGFCGCSADEMEKQMSPNVAEAYFVSQKVWREAERGEHAWDDVETVQAQRLGVSEKELKELIGRYNHFVQSKERERISYACQAYR